MKVYVVFGCTHCWECIGSIEVIGVYKTRKKAKEMEQKTYNNKKCSFDDVMIEEFDLE